MTLTWPVILEFLARSTLVLTLLLLTAGLCRRSLLPRQAILQIGLVSLLFLPLTLPIPKFRWTVVIPISSSEVDLLRSTETIEAKPPLAVPSTTPPIPSPNQGHALADSHRQFTAAEQRLLAETAPAPIPQAGRVPAPLAKPVPSFPELPVISPPPFRAFMSVRVWSGVYAIGVLLMWLRLAFGLWQLHSWRRRSMLHHADVWIDEVQACRQRLRIAATIEIKSTAELTTPLTFGWWRPTLIVPVAVLQRSTPAERRAIVLHELTHIQRQDFAWMIILHTVQSLYWFHPLMWWFAGKFTATQEEVCDAICVSEFGARTYSEALVNVARTTRRAAVLTLGLAMSRSSRLSQRLKRIQLQGGLSMSRLSRWNRWALWGAAVPCAIALMLINPVRAREGQATADASTSNASAIPNDSPSAPVNPENASAAPPKTVALAQKTETAQPLLPRVVVQLKDATGQAPLVSTAVRVRRLRRVNRFPEFEAAAIELTSDAAGLLTIPINDVPADADSVALEISATDLAPEFDEFPLLRTADQLEPRVLKLVPGLTLTTRVFDSEGRPVPDARVWILADVDEASSDTWRSYRHSRADGLLQLDVPRDKLFGFSLVSDRGAPYRIVCPAGTRQLSEIHLPRGCVVAGQLLDRQGKPVPNSAIVLEAEDSQAVSTEYDVKRHGGGSLDLEFSRETDAEGRFRFPPMAGDVRVYLNCNTATNPPQMVIPVSLKLPETGEKWLPLILAPTGKITGSIRWPDGRPVAKYDVRLEIPPNLSNSFINLCSAETDDQGRYSLDVPFPLETAELCGAGVMTGPDGKYWEIQPVTVRQDGGERRWHRLNRYLGETLTVDWVMVSRDQDRRTKPVELNSVAAEWQPLGKLEREIAAALDAYRAAPDEQTKAELNPSRRMVGRCLAFEAEHRGTRLAIGALHYIMRVAAMSTSDQDINAARDTAVQILDEHYLKHPDIDLLISEFNAGSGTPSAEPLLLHLAEQSPFDYVRAAALFELAEGRFDTLHLAENIYNRPLASEAEHEAMVKIQKSESSREWVRNQRAEALRFQARIKGQDLQQIRQSAIELLDRVINNYSHVKAPRRTWENTTGGHNGYDLKLVDSVQTWRVRTIPERAEILRFQKTRLQIGMLAPEIEGLDFHQRPIRLGQFKGQVVLLTMGVGPSDQDLCAKCRQVASRFSGQTFQSVSVVKGSGDGGWSVRSIVERGKIDWPIIRDTAEDDITQRWCQQTSPEIYIVDRQGIIRHLHLGNYISAEVLESQIQELLQHP